MRINREKERGGEAKQGPVGATFGPPALHAYLWIQPPRKVKGPGAVD